MKTQKSSWKEFGIPDVLALAASLITTGTARAQFGGLKNIKDKAQKAQEALKPMSVEEEKQVGREVAAKLIATFGLVPDDALIDYVNLVGGTVATQSERQEVPYRFAVLNSDTVNAFSAPGGYIFITRGALLLCEDEAELAGVLGHEVGHVAGRHVLKIFERDKAMRAGMDEAGSRMPGSKYLEDFSKKILIKVIDQGLVEGDEYDADQRGVKYAHAAGYPADGLSRFLAKLDEATTSKGKTSFWTKTHPPIAKRNERLGSNISSQSWQDADKPKLADRYTTETGVVRAPGISL
jgi:predicted Zn-dependent protease